MIKNKIIIGMAAFSVLALGIATASAQSQKGFSGVVQGKVTDAAGQPVAGAYVKLKNAERRLGFMVISRDGGTFTAKQLPPGNYALQGVGGDFQSKWSDAVAVADTGAAQQNLSLTDKRAPDLAPAWPRMLPPEVAATMPLPEGAGKDIVEARCTACHRQERFVGRGSTPQEWHEVVGEMRKNMKDGKQPDLTEEEAEKVVSYLAKAWPPMATPDENSRLPHTLVQGDARKYRVVQIDLPNPKSEPHDIAVDPQGMAWSNERVGGKMARFDPNALTVTEVEVPMLTPDKKARPGNLQIGADGILWMPELNDNRWVSYDIKADKWTSYPFPAAIRGRPNGNSMALSPDGTIWSTGPGAARRYDPSTKQWSAWDTPTWAQTHRNPGGYGIAIAGDGRAWFALSLADKLTRVNAKTGDVEEFKIPYEGTAFPRRMSPDPSGDVWAALWQGGKLVRVNQSTGAMTVIDPPTPNNGAYAITVDKASKDVWVTLHRVDKVGRYIPSKNEWTEFSLPQAETDVRRVEIDPHNPKRIFWSGVSYHARQGFIELLDE
jgi:virginiamycin B lyase